jgi:hypothetical protein
VGDAAVVLGLRLRRLLRHVQLAGTSDSAAGSTSRWLCSTPSASSASSSTASVPRRGTRR